MLKRLYVHNYCSLVHFEWRLPTVCALVGENGAGKSALVEVLWLLQDIVVEGRIVDETTSTSARTAWLNDAEQVIECDIAVGDDSFRYRLELTLEAGRGVVREWLTGAGGERLYASADGKAELYGDEPTTTPKTVVPFDRRRSFLSALEAGGGNRRVVAFREAVRSIVAVKPAHDLGGAAVSEAKTLDRDLRNFASWYRGRVGENPEAVEALRQDLEGGLKTFTALWLEPGADDSVSPLARFTANGRSYDVSWSQLSDGERRIIALYGLLRLGLRRASVIVLDDIDPFVSAAALLPWLRALVDAAAEHGQQLVIVTHHPEAIDYLAADAVCRMWRDDVDGRTCIEQLEPDRSTGETAYDLVRFGHVAAGVTEAP